MSSTIQKKGQGFSLKFYNEITQNIDYIGFYADEKEVLKKANDIDIKYYKKYPRLLPKGVSINRNNFQLSVKGNLVTSGKKNILVGSAKTLKEIRKTKLNVIKCLFD
jgi:hypothetical protein